LEDEEEDVKEANDTESPRADFINFCYSVEEEGVPPAATTNKAYTPAHSTSRKRSEVSPGDCSDLMDTPELQIPKMKGDKILQKDGQQHSVRPVPMRSDQLYQDEWTEEEGKQKEYGVERCILKKYGAGKVHVENLKRVMSTYPALKEVIKHNMEEINERLINNTAEWAEKVAEEIRGVPLSKETLMEKNELGNWFQERIMCSQGPIPESCQYTFLAQNAALLSKAQQQRSAKLYQKKMGEDIKPMEFMQCGVHLNGKGGHCLPMSK
jgi:hypothetical protein